MKIKEIEKVMERVKVLNTKEERVAFYEYAKDVPDGGIIVDIGTAAGGSALVFAMASKPNVKVYTIDPKKNLDFLDRRKETKLEKKLIFINKTSEDTAKGWNKKIDLLFIDGIHNYPGVMNDFTWFKKFVVKGGIVMFHDYYLYGDTIGKAVDEIVKTGEVEKIKIVDSLYQKLRIGLFISKKTTMEAGDKK